MKEPMQVLWGIDLGGTKTEGVILENSPPFRVIERLRIPTEREKGYAHIIDRIMHLVKLMREKSGMQPKTIGFGTPGTLDPILGIMKNCNTTVLNGQALKKDLEKALGIPVILANDANCFALAEASVGVVPEELPEAKMVFGVIMGTGVGGGIVYKGQVINGRQGIAGEWGHTFLDESGGTCYCGQIGCVEKIISGPALEHFYLQLSGHPRPLQEIVSRYTQGNDEAAMKTVKRLLFFFGKGMARVINILDPDAIVIGGGLGNIDLLYTKGVEKVRHFVFNNRLDTVFLKPKLGDSAGVYGAAFLTKTYMDV